MEFLPPRYVVFDGIFKPESVIFDGIWEVTWVENVYE